MESHPPKPVFSLALGVVGHRPNRLPEAALAKVSGDIAAVLDAIVAVAGAVHDRYHEYFRADAPLLSLVDAIAEGADRMVAEAALARGFVLDAPLPFSVDEYENDFATEPPRHHYRALLAKARNVLELPGERVAHSQAYERVGMTILGLSDLMLAVWDGAPAAGKGGTTAMVMTAIHSGQQPIIYVDATGKSPPKVIWGGFDLLVAPLETFDGVPWRSLDAGLPVLVDELIRPPGEAAERQNLGRYFVERSYGRNWRVEFPLLMALAGVRAVSRADIASPDPEAGARRFAASAAKTGAGWTDVAAAYGWASAIGGRFSQTFRSAYVANFVLGALAVVAAATSLLADNKMPFALTEAVVIGLLIANTAIGRRRDWHRRWIEAREITERLRISACLWSLAVRPAAFQGEEPSWTGWYARAFVRQQGMRAGSLRQDGLVTARDMLTALLVSQGSYNEVTAKRMGRLEHRLERFGLSLFVATAASTLYHLIGEPVVHAILPAALDAGVVTTVLGASLPALATASYGIRVIGDLEGIAHRAERTRKALEGLRKAIEADALDLGLLRARARAMAEVMLGDVSSWRLAAESRGLAIPG